MIWRVALCAVSMVGIPAGAVAQTAPAPDGALMQSCADRRFERVVTATVAGQPRSQKVKICGVAGQTDEAWKRTLGDAAAKVTTNTSMASEMRQQIVVALNEEIARLETAAVRPPAGAQPEGAVSGLVDLPKLPTAPPTPVRTAPARPTRSLAQDYGSLPPLPAPLAPAAIAAAAAAPKIPRPRLTLRCSVPVERRLLEECRDIGAGTYFTVRAEEPLGPGTRLRFLRKGDARAEVDLAAMSVGQSVRLPLPRPVCTGVMRGSVQIEVLRPGSSGQQQVVDAYGPYELRC